MNIEPQKSIMHSVAGLTLSAQRQLNQPKIDEYIHQLNLLGRAEATRTTAKARLERLADLCDISNPYEVSELFTQVKWKNSTKTNTGDIYTGFLQSINKTWQQPTYRKDEESYFIPTEQEIDLLIAAAQRKTGTLYQFLKETGARISEAMRAKWTDINTESATININPSKGSNPRTLPLSQKLLSMLNQLPHDNKSIFQVKKARNTIIGLRESLALKLNNPRFNEIHLHTFRHWKGTTEYIKTKDIMHVKYTLGHKSITSTMVYINLAEALITNKTDEYIAKVAHTEEEAIALIEAGFIYVNNLGTAAIYKKRK